MRRTELQDARFVDEETLELAASPVVAGELAEEEDFGNAELAA